MTRRTILIIALIFVSLVTFFWMFGSSEKDAEEEKEIIPASWGLNYKYNSRDPYGAYLFYELLKRNTDDFENVEGNPYEELKYKTGTAENILLVVYASNYVEYDFLWNQIDEFIIDGNKVLFILDEDPYRLQSYYNPVFSVSPVSRVKNTIHFTFGDSTEYTYQRLDDFKPVRHMWRHFSLNDYIAIEKDVEEEHPGAIVASDYDEEYYFTVHEEDEQGKPVFIEFPYGEGAVFIHRTPLAFTNYALLSEKNVEHLETILELIDYDGIIYNTHVIPKALPPEEVPRVSPIQFILSKPALKWAYYLTLVGLLLFFLFNLKRKQKSLEVLPPRENTTLEFADALSKIYYQKHNNKNIVKHKYRIFTTFIRTHYHIVQGKNREEYARLISAKSGVDQKTMEGLLNMMERFMKLEEINDDQLVTLHKLLNNFYKHCK